MAQILTSNVSPGVSDHGSLTDLKDDDHSQYHNDLRGDARYLYKENTNVFTPDGDYEPATKKYVDDGLSTISGAGDMYKIVYDTNDDGRVDKAESVDDGTYLSTASDIRTHLDDADKHREIDDGGIGATDLWSAQKINTVSGSLQTSIDGKSDTGHDHDGSYYTETELDTGQLDNRYYTESEVDSEIDSNIATFSGTIDHDTILNTHNLTTDIDHNQLTNYAADEHFTEASIDHSVIANLDYASAGHTGFASTSALTTTSGDLQTNIDAKDNYQSWSFAVDGVTKDAITSSDVLDFVGGDNITITRSADDQITISGAPGGGSPNHSELNELDYASAGHTGFADSSHIHDSRYYTETEDDANWVTRSGTIDHDTIVNTHNLTTDIDHNTLTNYSVDQHRTISDSGAGSTDLWSAQKIGQEIATISGKLDEHNELKSIQGGTTDEYYHLTSAQHTDLTDGGDTALHKHDGRYYTETEVDTISGALSAEIDSDITTHEAGSSHDSRYYTETEIDAQWVTNSGTIDHDTIINTHNLTTDIDHDQLTNTHDLTTDIDHGGISGLDDDDHQHYLLADGTRGITATISGVTPINDGDLTTKAYVDRFQAQLAGTTYFLHNHEDPTVSGYEQMLTQVGDEAEDYDTVTIGSSDGETLIDQYVTVSGEPNTGAIPAGSWTTHFVIYIGATTGDNYFRAKWYKRNTSGVETYLFQINSGDISAAGEILHIDEHTVVSGINLDVTDRLVVKMYAQTTHAVSREFRYYYEGQENYTYFSTPVVSNFILEHNNLVGLNNGNYKHLTSTVYTDLTDTGDTTLHKHDGRYYTETEIDTISGALSSEIDSDISTHSANGDHDGRYYTETELNNGQLDNRYHTEAEITTISGDLQTNIDAKDNYGSWSFAIDGVTKDAITSSDVLDFVGGDNITITRSADDQITISGSTGGTTDHGSLTGLTGDDHTQYVLANGTRAFTATVSGVTPTEDAHLATKSYVDNNLSAYVTDETPTGAVDGSNTVFTLLNTPLSGTCTVYLNGLHQKPGGENYTISGDQITFIDAPFANAIILCDYFTGTGGGPHGHDDRYYTETEIDNFDFALFSELTTTSGDLQTNIDGKSDVDLGGAPALDHTYNGTWISYAVGETVAYPDLLYFDGTDGEYKKAAASTAAKMPGVALALESKNDGEICNLFKYGIIRDDDWNWTPGGLLYASITSSTMTQTTLSGTGDQMQVLGYAMTADVIFFNPSYVLVEVA